MSSEPGTSEDSAAAEAAVPQAQAPGIKKRNIAIIVLVLAGLWVAAITSGSLVGMIIVGVLTLAAAGIAFWVWRLFRRQRRLVDILQGAGASPEARRQALAALSAGKDSGDAANVLARAQLLAAEDPAAALALLEPVQLKGFPAAMQDDLALLKAQLLLSFGRAKDNGTWFIWVVGTQSIAVTWAMLDEPGDTYARIAPLVAVLLWSVGVVLYLIVATLVLTRLLLVEVRPDDLTPPYWVTMGATAITVLAAAKILGMAPSPAVAATTAVVQGLAVVLWAFGTWLIPLLIVFGVWRHVLNRIRLEYVPTLWSIVFPLGMYAVASMELGTVAHLPIIAGIGRLWTWVAIAAWLTVFVGLCTTPLRALASKPHLVKDRSIDKTLA